MVRQREYDPVSSLGYVVTSKRFASKFVNYRGRNSQVVCVKVCACVGVGGPSARLMEDGPWVETVVMCEIDAIGRSASISVTRQDEVYSPYK